MKKIVNLCLLKILKLKIFRIISDEKYLELSYKLKLGKKLNLSNPKTFNEKLQWLKINDRKAVYTIMVDKYLVKKFISDIVGENYIIPTIGIYNKFDEIDFEKLPQKFAIKSTHDSGGIYICDDKNKIDLKIAKKKINKSLRNNYYYDYREWPYKNVKHRIIIEKYIGSNLDDYRFYCFNGKVKYIYQYLNESKKNGLKPEPTCCNIYDEKWNLMEFRQAYPKSKKKYNKPKQLNEMITLAEKLSENIPFLRVDFYIVDNVLYIGELTFFPGGGMSPFYPKDYDYKIGEMLKIENGKD